MTRRSVDSGSDAADAVAAMVVDVRGLAAFPLGSAAAAAPWTVALPSHGRGRRLAADQALADAAVTQEYGNALLASLVQTGAPFTNVSLQAADAVVHCQSTCL